MENHENRPIEIDMKRLLMVLWNRAWIILLAGALCATLAFGYVEFFITPTYSASAQLYVNNNYDSPGFSSSQLAAAQDLADTYMVIMRSRNVLGDVVEQTNLGYTYEQIRRMVSSASVNETEVFEVRVTCTNYQHAAIIANAIADVLPDKIAAVVDGSSVRVVDYAVENPNAVGPDHEKYVTMGATIGIILSACLIIVMELMDTTITSEEYLRQVYSRIPVMAVIRGSVPQKTGSYNYKGYYEAAQKSKPTQKSGGTGK